MQSPLVELEHFRELLKCSGDMACLKSHFGSRYPCSLKLSGVIAGLPSASFLFKTSPFFSSSCHGARCRTVLLMPGILPAMKQVMESNQLLR
jgi:hypothetical protein